MSFQRSTVAALLATTGVTLSAQDLYDENTLRSLHLTFAQSNWYTLLQQNYGTGVELAADLTVDGVTYPNVGVHFRGQSSYSFIGTSQKKPFGISMDAFVPGQRLLGYKSLNLNNGYRDPTFVREVLCYRVCRDSMAAGKANFVVLRVNGENWGVYVNVEQPNKDMLREWFVDEDGARFEANALLPGAVLNGSCLTYLGATAASYQNNYENKTPELATAWTPLIDACIALNNGPLGTLNNTLQPKLAVDAALRMIAAQIVLVNPDSYVLTGHNYYLYHDVFHGRMETIPWGLNLPLGASSLAGSTVTARSTWNLFYGETNTGRPLMNRLWAVPELRERYLAHVRTLLDQWFSWTTLQPLIAGYQNLIAAEVALDGKKLYPTAAFTSNVTTNYVAGTSTIAGLQVLVNARRPYLLGHAEVAEPAPTVGNLAHQPTTPTLGATVWVTATVAAPLAPLGMVTLWSRAVGPFAATAMFDDGLHQDGAANDGVFGAALPAYPPGSLVQYYVGAASAAAAGSAVTFCPRTAEFAPPSVQLAWPPGSGPVRIDEFLAINNTTIQDPAGEWEDYVELHNSSAAAVNVGGMYLTDNLLNPTKFMLPAGTTIGPNGVLLVWCDEDGTQGPLHANFKLAGGGEDLALFAANGATLLDVFTFGPQVADVATGRLFDGGLPWVSLPVPTPNALNAGLACGSRPYSALDSTSHSLVLSVSSPPTVGQTFSFDTFGGAPGGFGILVMSPGAAHLPLPGTTITLLAAFDPAAVTQSFVLGPTGGHSLPVPLPAIPSLAGYRAYAQSATFDGPGFAASNAVEIVICP